MSYQTSKIFTAIGLLAVVGVIGCSQESVPVAEAGTLSIEANGEDFVRQGFTTKDGWQISFDHVYVTLDSVKAYQTEPPFDPQQSDTLNAKTEVSLDQPTTIDLAVGSEPIEVGKLDAPAGRYNALSWQMVAALSGAAQGYPIMMVGSASKDGETIDFSLKLSEELSFTCGDFIGDERKGFVNSGESADVEATFHFDHLFGDAEAPAEDAINTGALGFDPLAVLAENGQLDIDSAALKTRLSDADHQKLMEILPSLGHVGEGHCEETTLTTSS
ncbi:hypothetical protein N836_14340 [Leptolyngbya sp. Heron Island J]|uniref:hypothetical protein n=1 Tax=Leptolyngbya sp. Heron Island J TaxID=1385935 RepID=UPI0003B99E22|nr:hypothetical protein [Leptolyngbya sp. Heron Island J]ESA34936.1 hypothetical protein N836_14340 [Leptolyngbya sp. Heron Island J]